MDPLEYLFGLEFHGHKFGLANIEAMAAALGHPQLACRTVIVAGTNGKGSVCAMLAAALTAAGFRTGRFTSPHLVCLEERVAIDGTEVTRPELDAAIEDVRAVIDRLRRGGGLPAQPTFFEVVTATAFVIFRRRRVDVAVLEVGLGGRLDATNVATPLVGAITTVDLDHQQHLGTTIAGIAAEKAGIAKPGMTVVCGERKPEAVDVIAATCRERRATFVQAYEGVDLLSILEAGRTTIGLGTPYRTYPAITLALRGSHQVQNALVAVRVLEALDAAGVPVPAAAVAHGLARAVWRGRLDLVELDRGRRVLLDAAHNPAGAASLAAALLGVFPRPVPLVFGAVRDKDHAGILRALLLRVSHVILTEPPTARAALASELLPHVCAIRPDIPVLVEPDPARALGRALELNADVCVAGSIFLLGAILPLLPSGPRA